MTEERKQQLLNCWENEVTADDEDWREDLTPEEAAMVEEWDNQYDTGTATLASKILDAEERRLLQLTGTGQEKQR